MGGETVTVRMARGDRSTPWGFGVSEAANRGVIVCRVVPGSLADRAGLRNGDILDELEGLKDLDVVATDRLLVTSRDRIELIVHRNTNSASASSSFAVDGQARIWRPEITTDSQINKFQDSTHHIPPTGGGRETNVRVSLEHSNTSQPPRGFNSSALPFNTDPRVSHAQYNSPLGLYSKTNAEEQYHLQTSDALSKMRVSTPQQQPAKAVDNSYRSETMRLIQEEAARGGGARGNSLSSHPNPQGLPSCFVCQRPILGVMARAAGHEVHGDCLSCSTCGASLKNIGHHFIDDKFYCDVHGAQKKGQGPRFDSAPAPKPSTPTVAYTARAAEPPKSFYQPDVLSRRPLSVSPNPAVHSSTYTTTSNIHVSNPKTGGPISPANRGVPTNPSFGVSSARPVSPPSYAPPPPPSTAPPVIGSSYSRSSYEPARSAAPPTANGGGANGYRGGPRYNNTSSTTTKTVTTTYGAQPPSSLTTTRGSLQQENSTRVPYCESCNQAIRGPFVLAGGRSWCPDHFVCTNSTCRRRLLECGFVEENGQKFCETCFEKHIAPKCSKCNTAIVSDCLNALQKKWHPACFTCAHCQTPFGNAAFYLEQGLPYCEKDWNMLFTTKCVSCRYPIEAGDRWVEALGSAYHSNCFSCTRCRVNLEGESFYAKNGEPYCKAHA